MYGILTRQLFFVANLRQLCTVGHGIVYMADVNTFLLVNKIVLISPDISFKTVAKSCLTVSFTYDFLNTDISQGSVATHLGFGGVFIHHFVTNFLLSLTVKEF